MRKRLHGRAFALLVGALFVVQWTLTAQSQPAVSTKRPLTYDVVDYWKSIQGTRLSDDGQWLAYSLDGAGRGRRAGRPQRAQRAGIQARARHRRPFTPDGKFVVFTIAQPKADEERERREPRPRRRRRDSPGGRRRQPQDSRGGGGRTAGQRRARASRAPAWAS